jgi:hypothetical protein
LLFLLAALHHSIVLLSRFIVKSNVRLLEELNCQLLSCIDGLVPQLGIWFPRQVLLPFVHLIGGAMWPLDTAERK